MTLCLCFLIKIYTRKQLKIKIPLDLRKVCNWFLGVSLSTFILIFWSSRGLHFNFIYQILFWSRTYYDIKYEESIHIYIYMPISTCTRNEMTWKNGRLEMCRCSWNAIRKTRENPKTITDILPSASGFELGILVAVLVLVSGRDELSAFTYAI